VPIRARLALLFAGAALLLLTGGGLVFLRQLSDGLNASLDTTLRARADALISTVVGAEGPDFQDAPSRLLRTSDTVAQVLSTTGAVLESSDGLSGQPLLTARQVGSAARGPITVDRTVVFTASGTLGAQVGPHTVRLLAVQAGRDGRVVVVGRDRDVVDTAVERAGTQLAVLGAVVLLLSGTGAWLLARAALRPVERMRIQAADLGAGDAGTELAVPSTRDEVSRLAVTMNGLLGRLHTALARERSFVADAGHELRTPLTILKGELELARRPGRSLEQLTATVAVAAEETDRLIRLAEDLLLLARAQEGPFLRLRATDLTEVARGAVSACAAGAAAAGVHLRLLATAGTEALVDPDRLRQALDNLLANALRHAPSGSTVEVAVSATDDRCELTVTDQGPGFPDAFLPVTFGRFRRPDASRAAEQAQHGTETGSGLGLAIVRAIAVAHGGQATAGNTETGGAWVTLTLPGLTLPRPCPRTAHADPAQSSPLAHQQHTADVAG
jgi:two-component system OmpR family sensor kinase